MDGVSHIENANYKALTEGVHGVEALELVKQHLSTMLGEAPAGYSNMMMKMSKLQAAQMYAASVMFGYFLRRADKRFQVLHRPLFTAPHPSPPWREFAVVCNQRTKPEPVLSVYNPLVRYAPTASSQAQRLTDV
eukprot:1175985-Prorocentrum_minimum.AAC.6